MEAQDIAMLVVLTKLAMTSNGTTARMDADSGGGSARHHESTIPRLGAHDAPHLFYAGLYDDARSDHEREEIVARARDELDRIQHSRGDRSLEETKDARDQRMVEEGVGWAAIDVAVHFRVAEADVRRARAAHGCEEEYGEAPVDGKALGAEQRQSRVAEMQERGMSPRQISFALGISRTTTLRDLGRRQGY